MCMCYIRAWLQQRFWRKWREQKLSLNWINSKILSWQKWSGHDILWCVKTATYYLMFTTKTSYTVCCLCLDLIVCKCTFIGYNFSMYYKAIGKTRNSGIPAWITDEPFLLCAQGWLSPRVFFLNFCIVCRTDLYIAK